MNITFVLPGIGGGGGVRVVFEYANRLQDRGHKVNIVYPLFPLRIKPNFNLKSLAGQTLGAIANFKKRNQVDWLNLKAKLTRVPTLGPRYAKFVEKLVPDADVVVATAWETAYTVSKLSQKKGEKFYFVQSYEIWDVWNDDECWRAAEKKENDPNKLCLAMHDVSPKNEDLRIIKDLVDKTYKMPLKKITISSWLKELIEKKFGEEVEALIVNGVNFDTFYKEDIHDAKRQMRVLMPYRPIRLKGTEDGLKAFGMVKEKYHDVEFIMYGAKRGKDIPEWIELYEKFLYDYESRKLYSSSDIFILPSWVEGCQLPPMEAMACGCAVVATNVGGVPDYAINGETVLASPPRNPEILAQNIIKLIENEDERKRIAENGYNYVKQFTWDRATNQLEKVFKKYV